MVQEKKKQAQILIDSHRLEEAKVLYQQICTAEPGDADAWFMLGIINGQLGLAEDVMTCCRKAIEFRPEFAEAHFNLGKALRELGHMEQAADSYRIALKYKPDWPQALNNLGNILQDIGKLDEAVSCYRQAIVTKQDYVDAHTNLGNVLNYLGRVDDAIASYRRAIACAPHYPLAYKCLGRTLIDSGELDGAQDCFNQLKTLTPNDIEILIGQARILERRGQHEQAAQLIRPYLHLADKNIELALIIATLSKPLSCTDQAIQYLEQWLNNPSVKIGRQYLISIHFSLGALYDDKKEYDRAFEHVSKANELKPRSFDVQAFQHFIDDVISFFSIDFMASVARPTEPSARPIFIVGMPRSGTTLVEQILATHPQVFGAGELEDIRLIVADLPDVLGGNAPYPECLDRLQQNTIDQMARRYLDRLSRFSPTTRYITDKMPQNFLYLGLIAILFPEARIIHCMRDPLDTCLSCYFHDFGGAHSYAYNLQNLGSYYTGYRRLTQHWHQVLNTPLMDIRYEDLVADQQAVTRKLLDFCALEWDERCLHFYANERIVSTLSYDQVRKPVYTSSIGKWKHYEGYLGALKQALSN